MNDSGRTGESRQTGGNSTTVSKVGNTVRRSEGSYSPSVHELLLHLERSGFESAPRFLGIDEAGREILSYIPGTVGNYPMPDPVRSMEALDTAVLLLRRFHDVSVDFEMPAGHKGHLPTGALPEVVCHWDAAPYNFVFDGSSAIGIIDFDEAGPGRRIDDLAYFAYRFAPLCDDHTLADGGWPTHVDKFGRLSRIFDLYPDTRASQLPDLIIDRLSAIKRGIETRYQEPNTSTSALEAHTAIYSRDQLFIDEHRRAIIAAVN